MGYLDKLRRAAEAKGVRAGSAWPEGSPRPPAPPKAGEHLALEPGLLVWWRSNKDGQTRGPAVLRGTFEDNGQVWAWFTLAGTEYLIRTDSIVKVQGPEGL